MIKGYIDLEVKRMYLSIKCENWKLEVDNYKYMFLGKKLRFLYFMLFLFS